jgi:hypothetical protein
LTLSVATKSSCSHDHSHHDHNEEEKLPSIEDEFVQIATSFFEAQFGDGGVKVVENMELSNSDSGDIESSENDETELSKKHHWQIKVDSDVAAVVLQRGKAPEIDCSSEELKRRISTITSRICKTLEPINSTYAI